MRGGEKTVQIGRSLVGKPLTEIRHRRARADAARLVPRLPCFLRASKLAQDNGSIRMRRNEVRIPLHDLAEGVQGLCLLSVR